MEKVKAFREKIEIKYIISGLVALFLFLILLSAAPSPWWFEKIERTNTTLEMTTWEFMTHAKTFGDDGVPTADCDYVDDCIFTVNLVPADSKKYHPIYSTVAAFTIMAIVLSFSLGVASIVFAFFSRRLPDTAKLIVNIVNSVLALVLSFFIIIGWVLLISNHKNMVQDATGVDNDSAMCDLYKKIDIRLGGSACSFAARTLDSTTGDLVRSWGPMAGWILACCAFWICLLVYLPLTLLWVMITSADVNLCPSKSKGSRTSKKNGKNKKTIELDSYDRGTDSKEGDAKRSKTTDTSDDEGNSKDNGADNNHKDDSEDDKSSKKSAKDDVDSGDDEPHSESDSESESDD